MHANLDPANPVSGSCRASMWVRCSLFQRPFFILKRGSSTPESYVLPFVTVLDISTSMNRCCAAAALHHGWARLQALARLNVWERPVGSSETRRCRETGGDWDGSNEVAVCRLEVCKDRWVSGAVSGYSGSPHILSDYRLLSSPASYYEHVGSEKMEVYQLILARLCFKESWRSGVTKCPGALV